MNRIARIFTCLIAVCAVTACATVDVSRFATLPAQGPRSNGLLLIVHGSGYTAETWPIELEHAVRNEFPGQSGWDIVRVDWASIAERRLSAPREGRKLGREIAREIIDGHYTYDVIHMVGHSVGAHVVHGVTTGFREHEEAAGVLPRQRTIIHETLLDPFLGDGILDWDFGAERFGVGADFAFSYMTTDDRTPMTNAYLTHAFNLDLSHAELAAPVRGLVESHYLPVVVYQRSVVNVAETGPGFALSPYIWAEEATRETLVAGYALFSQLYPRGQVSPKVVD